MNWKTSIIACALLLSAASANAQHTISGYVYEMQSGEPLEGVRILMKNRQGLEIGTMPAAYSDAEGYFEFANVKPRDYRAEVTHTFDTPDGPMGLRLFTNSDVIAVDTSDYKLNIGLSRYKVDQHRMHMALNHLRQKANNPEFAKEYEHKLSQETRELMRKLQPDWKKRIHKMFIEDKLLSSRVIGNHREIRAMEMISPIRGPANGPTRLGGRP